MNISPDGEPFARIKVAVERAIQRYKEDCQTERGPQRTTRATGDWRWSRAKGAYEAHMRRIEALLKQDEP